ncbi:hypothetical protein BGZ49_006312 [Haplosporangium sp. Z 27]|nr:hypothetical protein BGZ49_006312 [Haplosporangium sp. Z 27]
MLYHKIPQGTTKNNDSNSHSPNDKTIEPQHSNKTKSRATRRQNSRNISNPQQDAQTALQPEGEVTKDNLYANTTQKTYAGHLGRAKEIVAALDDRALQEAFYTLSSRTPEVLLFIVRQRIDLDGLAYSTAEGNSQQSLPMTYKDLGKLMVYLNKPEVIEKLTEGLCLCDELLTLKSESVTREQDLYDSEYINVKLVFRKTNQLDLTKGRWLRYLEGCMKRPLSDDDLIFPSLDSDGFPNIGDKFSYARLQKLLDTITREAGLLENRKNGKYTTHCFRRGGAQHRFMFADEKWSLKAVKWWGGWSEGEGHNTIMTYLLDDFTRYENGYRDMLCPHRNDSRHTQFMGGEAEETDVVTQKTLQNSLGTLRASFKSELSDVKSVLESLAEKMTTLAHQQSVLVENQQEILAALGYQLRHPELRLPELRQQPEQQQHPPSEKVQLSKKAFFPRIPKIKHWKEAIGQWEKPDFARGLNLPLKLWTKEMRDGKLSPKFSQRKLIFKEYCLNNRSDEEMRRIYGEALDTIRKLLPAIRAQKKLRKGSNGINDKNSNETEDETGESESKDEETEEGEGNEGEEEDDDEGEEDEEEEVEKTPFKRQRR